MKYILLGMQILPLHAVYLVNPIYPCAIVTKTASILHIGQKYLVKRIKITAGSDFILAKNVSVF